MPCGHTDLEFAQFTKTERRILRMLLETHPPCERKDILAMLEITDSTLRVHLAHIRGKQARMRVLRAQVETQAEEARLASKYLPEMEIDPPEAEVPKRVFSPFRREPVSEPPLAHTSTVAPRGKKKALPFVTLHLTQKKENAFRPFGVRRGETVQGI